MPPTVSVIIPAYNAAAFVGKALESVLAQTVPPLEIIVVDDGSKDATVQAVQAYVEGSRGEGAPEIRLFCQANGGPASARNRGAKEARGEWLAFLDSDDSWLPEKLEKQLPYTAPPTTGVVMSWQRVNAAPGEEEPPPPQIDFETLWKRNLIITSTTLVRRQAFEEVGGFDEDRALIGVEDYNLWLRLSKTTWQFVPCPGKLFHYTPGPASLTGQVERFVQAELTNVAKIGTLLGLDTARLRAKRLALYEQYGRDLFYDRHLPAARRLFSQALREGFTPRRLLWWLATFLPVAALDFRRRLASRP